MKRIYLPLSEKLARQIPICLQKHEYFLGCALADSVLPPQSHFWPTLGLWCRPLCRPGGVPGTGSEVTHRGPATQTGTEAGHRPGTEGLGASGPVEETGS